MRVRGLLTAHILEKKDLLSAPTHTHTHALVFRRLKRQYRNF